VLQVVLLEVCKPPARLVTLTQALTSSKLPAADSQQPGIAVASPVQVQLKPTHSPPVRLGIIVAHLVYLHFVVEQSSVWMIVGVTSASHHPERSP